MTNQKANNKKYIQLIREIKGRTKSGNLDPYYVWMKYKDEKGYLDVISTILCCYDASKNYPETFQSATFFIDNFEEMAIFYHGGKYWSNLNNIMADYS